MTVPAFLGVAGVACLVMAGVFAVVSIRVFVTQDILGVYDDLAGRSRQRGIDDAVRARTRRESRPSWKTAEQAVGTDDAKTRVVTRTTSQDEQTVVVARDESQIDGTNGNAKGGE
ncbi:MAG: hypothetical protein J6S63_10690 [Atopobiaceae bacterium]|nr:hypothetical protein [Atopobiaceae bacterium]